MSLISKLSKVTILAIAFIAFGTITFAQETPPAKEDAATKEHKSWGKEGEKREWSHRGHHRGFRGLRGIELTEAQKVQVRVIKEANRPDQTAMDEIKSIFQAKRSGTITEAQKERLAVLKQQKRDKAKLVNDQIRAILTQEQIQQIETRKAKREQMRQERMTQRELKKAAKKPATN
ncbi:MAG: Spy/CpxP family protein refolding chaperone [Pyrinomonadaceae bacterium]